MKFPFGQTRTSVAARHALFAADGHVLSRVPGWEKAQVVSHITPGLGAKLMQATVTLEAEGTGLLDVPGIETFLYVLDGRIEVQGGKDHLLGPGMFYYSAPNAPVRVKAAGAGAKISLFQKHFTPLAEARPPASFSGDAARVPGQPFLGNPKALLQVLLPDELAFDMAVNIFTYQPGATLPFVETHIMEHGLLMLAGQGIYRLEDQWYPVTAGDVIWMAPYCPQWFVAMGDEPASYLYYKDVNRPLLS